MSVCDIVIVVYYLVNEYFFIFKIISKFVVKFDKDIMYFYNYMLLDMFVFRLGIIGLKIGIMELVG